MRHVVRAVRGGRCSDADDREVAVIEMVNNLAIGNEQAVFQSSAEQGVNLWLNDRAPSGQDVPHLAFGDFDAGDAMALRGYAAGDREADIPQPEDHDIQFTSSKIFRSGASILEIGAVRSACHVVLA